jgi:hypothetical protein
MVPLPLKESMSEDYLAGQRTKSLTDDSLISESELHATHANIKESWDQLQDCRRRIAIAKQEASAKVHQEFTEELQGLEANYAMVMTLSR